MKLEELQGVVVWWNHDTQFFSMLALAIVAVTSSVLLLSAAGIYSMMSFTVARRRREIGIRTALGADARRVLAGIFGRAAMQLGAGIAAGVAIAAGLEWASGGGTMDGRALTLLPIVVVLMFTVGALAALGPARRDWPFSRRRRCATSEKSGCCTGLSYFRGRSPFPRPAPQRDR